MCSAQTILPSKKNDNMYVSRVFSKYLVSSSDYFMWHDKEINICFCVRCKTYVNFHHSTEQCIFESDWENSLIQPFTCSISSCWWDYFRSTPLLSIRLKFEYGSISVGPIKVFESDWAFNLIIKWIIWVHVNIANELNGKQINTIHKWTIEWTMNDSFIRFKRVICTWIFS